MKICQFKGNIFRILKEIPRGMFLKNLLWSVLSGVLPLLFLFLVKLIIDRLGNSGIEQVFDVWRVSILVAFAGLVYFGQNVLGGVAGLAREKMGYHLGERMYGMLHERSIRLSLETLEDPACQDQYHRAARDITYRPQRITASIMQLAQSMVSLVLLIGLFFYIHWIIALVLFVASVPLAWVRLVYARKHHKLLKEELNKSSASGRYTFANVAQDRIIGEGDCLINSIDSRLIHSTKSDELFLSDKAHAVSKA
jgi:ABC-type multidrug transport system fused ATPase/permease subunit